MKRLSLGILLLLVAGCGSTTGRPGIAGAVTADGVELSWVESDPSAVSFVIEREDGASGFSRVNPETVSAAWFTDSTVQHGTTYTYQVTALNASGARSEPSNQFTIYVP